MHMYSAVLTPHSTVTPRTRGLFVHVRGSRRTKQHQRLSLTAISHWSRWPYVCLRAWRHLGHRLPLPFPPPHPLRTPQCPVSAVSLIHKDFKGYEPNAFTEESFIENCLNIGLHKNLSDHPLDLEIKDEQSKDLLASPLSYRSEKQVQTYDDKFITRTEKTRSQTFPDFNPARRNLLLWSTVKQRKMPPRFMEKRVSSFSQRCTLKYWSNIAKLRRLKQTFVNFNDKASRRERQEFSEELSLRGGALRELRIGGLQKVEELKNYSRKTIWRTLQAKIKKSIYELILQLKSVN